MKVVSLQAPLSEAALEYALGEFDGPVAEKKHATLVVAPNLLGCARKIVAPGSPLEDACKVAVVMSFLEDQWEVQL